MAKHITRTISNNSYWQINKHLARTIGLEATLVLQHLIDLQTKVFEQVGFFQTTKQLMEELSLSKHHIQNSVSKLKQYGIITVESKLHNNRNHYTVLLGRVEELLQVDGENFSKYLDTHNLDNNQSTSGLNINQVLEQKLSNQLDEISSTHIEKNIKRKESNKKEIIKKNTSSSAVGEKNILNKLLDDLIQTEDVNKFKSSYYEIEDYGGIDKVFDFLELDESQRTNWNRKINNVILINQAV
jgi:biotin operon repressor